MSTTHKPSELGESREPLPCCQLCGEPMPEGEEMFNYHGYSGPCPKPPLPRTDNYVAWLRNRSEGDRQWIEVCDSDSPGAFKVYRHAQAASVPSSPTDFKGPLCDNCGRTSREHYCWQSDDDYSQYFPSNRNE